MTCNISSNQLEISNIRDVVDNGIQKRELIDLEGVVETNLEQSYEKCHIVTKFKDSDRNNEETDIETQTVANMTVSNNKNDSDISNNKKYVFPNVSYVNILKQTSGMGMPSNLSAYVPPQLTSPISQVSESDLYLTQGDQSPLETLETLCGSASTGSKFVDGRIEGNFVSDYVFNLSQKTLSPLEIKVLEKRLGFSPTPSLINEVDLRRDISDFWRKMRCKCFLRNERQENVSETSWFWKRFIDDIFFIWTESEESLEKFLEDINKFHPNLKFTYEKSKEKINFLDVVIKINEGRIITDLYCKPTDGHQYLHSDSWHADDIKRSNIFIQTLRLKRICSEKK